MTDYEKLVEETRARVLEYAEQDWPIVRKSHGVEVSMYSLPSLKSKVYKAVGELDVPPIELIKFVGGKSDLVRKKVHKIIKSWEVMREVSQNVFVLRTVSKSLGGGIISAREYFDVVGSFIDHGLHMVCATGVDYPYPNDDKVIRGWNHCSAMLCYPVLGHPDKTKLIYLLHTDLKGKVPAKIVDSALPDTQLNYFSNLRKAIKDGLEPSE